MFRIFSWLTLFVVLFACGSGVAFGQATGSVSGTVTDAKDAVVPGAKVSVKNLDTGIGRDAVTDQNGNYRVTNLLSGKYEITAEQTGFQKVARQVDVIIASEQRVDVQMPTGEVSEVVQITGEAPLIEETKTEVGQAVTVRQLENLPVSGRNFVDLTLLTPRVLQSQRSSEGTAQQVWGVQFTQLSFAGLRNSFNILLLDGADATWHSANLLKSFYSLDSVREFKVINGMSSAEYGRSMGGIVTVSTKTGGNELHGTGFFNYRNEALDARNILTRPESDKFRQKQFGIAVGGPLVKNKAFFFGNYEGLRQEEAPQIASIIFNNLALINTTLRGLGMKEEDPGIITGRKNNIGLARVDWNPNNKHQVLFRYNIFDEKDTNLQIGKFGVFGLSTTPNGGLKYSLRDQAFVAGVTSFGGKWVNEALFEYSPTSMHSVPTRQPQIEFIILSVGELGNSSSFDNADKRLELKDNVSYNTGSHQFKFGGDYNHISSSSHLGPSRRLSIFGSLAAFAAVTPAQDQLYTDFPFLKTSWNLLGAFVQDNWRVTPKLTLDLGLRYDVEKLGGDGPVINKTDKNNFQPRIGFAYSPSRGTVIRGGFGVFTGLYFEPGVDVLDGFGRVNFPSFSQAFLNANPFARNYTPRPDVHTLSFIGGPPAKTALLSYLATGAIPPPPFGSGAITISRPDLPNPYALQWGIEIERDFSGVTVGLNYTGVQGRNIPVFINLNNPPATIKTSDGSGKNDYQFSNANPFTRFDPAFTTILVGSPVGRSIYHGGTLTVRKSFTTNFGFTANYTFSKGIDNNQSLGTQFLPQDPYRIDLDRSLSSDDLPHRLVANLVAESPKTWNVLLRDSTISISSVAESGRVHNIRANLGDLNHDGNIFTDRPGALGRNTYRGPKFFAVDLRLARSIKFSERVKTDLSIDFFNLFNRVNISQVDTFLNSANPNVIGNPNFGQPTLVANSRQIRLGARVTW